MNDFARAWQLTEAKDQAFVKFLAIHRELEYLRFKLERDGYHIRPDGSVVPLKQLYNGQPASVD